MDHFCYLCFVFVMFSPLFTAALRSPAWKGSLGSLVCDFCILVFYLVFVTLSCGVLGQVRYLIVSIPDLCPLKYLQFNPMTCNIF